MIDDDQQGASPVDAALEGGTGHDLADADRPRLLDAGEEVFPHRLTEVGFEVAGTEGEHLGDVLGGRPMIERRDGDGEVVGELDRGRVGDGESIVVQEAADGETRGDRRDDKREREGDSAATEVRDAHRPTLHRAQIVSWALAATLAIVAIGATILSALGGPSERERRDDLLEVGTQVTLAITTYDYRDLDATRAAVLADALPSFELEYEQLLDASGLGEALRANEAIATGEITVGPMVASLDANEARLFAVVEQQVAGKETEAATQRLRVEVTLVETLDGWKASNVEVT